MVLKLSAGRKVLTAVGAESIHSLADDLQKVKYVRIS